MNILIKVRAELIMVILNVLNKTKKNVDRGYNKLKYICADMALLSRSAWNIKIHDTK